jgi:hypothetical protein
MSVRISPIAAFWAAASIARDPTANDRARRRSLLVLTCLALRIDWAGAQARAVLRALQLPEGMPTGWPAPRGAYRVTGRNRRDDSLGRFGSSLRAVQGRSTVEAPMLQTARRGDKVAAPRISNCNGESTTANGAHARACSPILPDS